MTPEVVVSERGRPGETLDAAHSRKSYTHIVDIISLRALYWALLKRRAV